MVTGPRVDLSQGGPSRHAGAMPPATPPDQLTVAGAFREGALEVLPIVAGIIPFGLVAGAAAVDAGLGLEGAVALSVLVFAGASQLASIDLLARDAPLLIILLTVGVINLRMAMYSASLAPRLADVPLLRRLAVAYPLVDQAYALTIMRIDRAPARPHRVAYYAGVAVPLWVNWQIMTVVGAVLGSTIPDWLPLEATIPLVFLAMLVPAITDRATLVAGVVSGAVATLGVGLPNNSGLLVGAFSGIAAGTVVALRSDTGSGGQEARAEEVEA